MNVTPLDLRQQHFRTVMRGFDKTEVLAFLIEAADDYEAAMQDADRQRQEVARLEGQVAEHREHQRNLSNTLLTAQRLADEIADNAQTHAATLSARSSRSRACCSRTKSSVLLSVAMSDSTAVSASRRFSRRPSISRCTSSMRAWALSSRRVARASASLMISGGVSLGVVRDFVGQPLGSEQRVAQVPLVLPMLGDLALEPRDVLALPIGLLHGGFVVIGGFDQEREHLGLVETAHHGPEVLLTQVERRDVHACAPVIHT